MLKDGLRRPTCDEHSHIGRHCLHSRVSINGGANPYHRLEALGMSKKSQSDQAVFGELEAIVRRFEAVGRKASIALVLWFLDGSMRLRPKIQYAMVLVMLDSMPSLRMI